MRVVRPTRLEAPFQLKLLGIGLDELQFAGVGQDEQIVFETRDGAGADLRLFPDQFSGGKLDATQIRPAMFPGVTVKAIDVILINYPGGVMRGNAVVKVPESFRFALFHADELRAKFVSAGKNKITEDDRSDFPQANPSPWLWNGTKSAVLPVASLTPHRMATAAIWQSAMRRERRPVALNNSAALRASAARNGSGADRRSWASKFVLRSQRAAEEFTPRHGAGGEVFSSREP